MYEDNYCCYSFIVWGQQDTTGHAPFDWLCFTAISRAEYA